MRALILVSSTMLLAACAHEITPEEQAAMSVRAAVAQRNQDAADNNQCVIYGAQPGTDTYVRCRVSLAQMRQQMLQSQAADEQARRAAIIGAIIQNNQTNRPYQAPPPTPIPIQPAVNCTTSYIGNQAYTHCQ